MKRLKCPPYNLKMTMKFQNQIVGQPYNPPLHSANEKTSPLAHSTLIRSSFPFPLHTTITLPQKFHAQPNNSSDSMISHHPIDQLHSSPLQHTTSLADQPVYSPLQYTSSANTPALLLSRHHTISSPFRISIHSPFCSDNSFSTAPYHQSKFITNSIRKLLLTLKHLLNHGTLSFPLHSISQTTNTFLLCLVPSTKQNQGKEPRAATISGSVRKLEERVGRASGSWRSC